MDTKKSTYASYSTNNWSSSLSLREMYKRICEKNEIESIRKRGSQEEDVPKNNIEIGIIGGGVAGLYSGLLLKNKNIKFHIFEADPERVGGRIYTHRFDGKKDQYFEAGAMRIPCVRHQENFFKLVDYVNKLNAKEDKVELIDYVIVSDENYVYVNGVRNDDGSLITYSQANANPAKLNFLLDEKDKNTPAQDLLNNVLKDPINQLKKILEKNDEKEFEKFINKYDHYSMHSYLLMQGWSENKIDYVETMTSQTQQFEHSFVELLMENIDFTQAKWQTIKDGMSRLPEACKKIIGSDNISLNAEVFKIREEGNKVKVYYKQADSDKEAVFDRVILAVPPAVVRMLDRPLWSVEKERAIRCIHFQPLYKIGLRFKSRFWEIAENPSYGGQSTTDLPSRWIVYPSYGTGDSNEGVLLCYSWMADALKWLSKSPEQQTEIALRDISQLYGKKVTSEFIESKPVSWAAKWTLGDAKFLPGQFRDLYQIARKPEKNIYFAGEHLSPYHTWIVGAIDSALYTCGEILNTTLAPLSSQTN